MESTYTETRSNFAELWDKVIDYREPLIVHRRGAEDIALLPAAELSSLQETAHLLRSPKNAQRLLAALSASMSREGTVTTTGDLKRDLLNE